MKELHEKGNKKAQMREGNTQIPNWVYEPQLLYSRLNITRYPKLTILSCVNINAIFIGLQHEMLLTSIKKKIDFFLY